MTYEQPLTRHVSCFSKTLSQSNIISYESRHKLMSLDNTQLIRCKLLSRDEICNTFFLSGTYHWCRWLDPSHRCSLHVDAFVSHPQILLANHIVSPSADHPASWQSNESCCDHGCCFHGSLPSRGPSNCTCHYLHLSGFLYICRYNNKLWNQQILKIQPRHCSTCILKQFLSVTCIQYQIFTE